MRQVVQSFKTGELTVVDVPNPQLKPDGVLVRNVASVVSAGTERRVVNFAKKNLLQKAQDRPDLVRQVLEKAQREGVISTIDAVRNRLDHALPLGYSSAGRVVAVGSRVVDLKVGDRVACAGGGYASHAELIYVPRTLAVRLPKNVSFENAAFATLGAIAMHGVRIGEASVGESVLVIGLGVIGLIAVQILKASGCQVMGVDPNPNRVELARQLGADAAYINKNVEAAAVPFTNGHGFDLVLITADTPSNEPVELAGSLVRKQGIVVSVGVVGTSIPYRSYYEKEADFRISRSYGPGRYDSKYEDQAVDYPYSYVRWTEQRNIESVLYLISQDSLRLDPIITHRYAITDALIAYDLINGKLDEPFMGVLLTYDPDRTLPDTVKITKPSTITAATTISATDILRVGALGAGNFANATLFPALRRVEGVSLLGLVSSAGLSARNSSDRFGFAYCTTSIEELLKDENINQIVISTRHDLHAAQTITALNAGKDVFTEKPLAIDKESLRVVVDAVHTNKRRLMVGFNRRFAPMSIAMREFLAKRQNPCIATYRVNAGHLPPDHWMHDPAQGGGRIIAEGCHFIDLIQYLLQSPVREVMAYSLERGGKAINDEVTIVLRLEDGSVGNVIYTGGGDKSYSKEFIEIIGDGRVAAMDDFKKLVLVHNGRRKQMSVRPWKRATKGHYETWVKMVEHARSGKGSPIPLEEIVNSHLATFAAVESLKLGTPIVVEIQGFWKDVRDEGVSK